MIKKIPLGNAANFAGWGGTYTAPAGNDADIDFPILERTIVKNVVGVTNGTILKYAWFEESTPDTFTLATNKGTAEVTSNQITITIITFIDQGQNGFLIMSDTDGSTTQCLSNAMPIEVP